MLLAVLFTSTPRVHATPVTALLGGTIDRLASFPAPPWCCTDYGLGIDAGDHFMGTFSYDTDAERIGYNRYVANEFSIRIGGIKLDTTNDILFVQPYDSYVTYVGIQGQLTGGLYMSVALFTGDNPGPITSYDPPTYLSDSDWRYACFKISPHSSIPVADLCGLDDEAIKAGSWDNLDRTPNDFFLFTIPVPEPSAILLLGIGLIGWAAWRRRKTA